MPVSARLASVLALSAFFMNKSQPAALFRSKGIVYEKATKSPPAKFNHLKSLLIYSPERLRLFARDR